jgi:hypothetical protein
VGRKTNPSRNQKPMQTIAKSPARKADPFDPKPVIQYAANRAATTNQPQYVIATGAAFIHLDGQPDASHSHWRIEPNGDLFAHIEANQGSKITYEAV